MHGIFLYVIKKSRFFMGTTIYKQYYKLIRNAFKKLATNFKVLDTNLEMSVCVWDLGLLDPLYLFPSDISTHEGKIVKNLKKGFRHSDNFWHYSF